MGDIGRILDLIGGGGPPVPTDQQQEISLGGPLPPPVAPEPPPADPVLPMPQVASEGLAGALEQILGQSPQGPGMPGVSPTMGVPLTEPLAGLPELPFASPAEAGRLRRASQVSELPPSILADEIKTTRFPAPADATDASRAPSFLDVTNQPANMRATGPVQGYVLPEETRTETARRNLRQMTSLEEPGLPGQPQLSGEGAGLELSGRFMPLVGEALDVRDAIRSFREGNYGEAGLNAAAAMIPIIPGSSMIRRGLSQLGPRKRVQWVENYLQNNPVQRWVPESRGVFDRKLMNDTEFFVGDPLPRFNASRADKLPDAAKIARSKDAQRMLRLQAERGMALGGETFYQTQPVIASINEVAGQFSPDDVMWALAFSSPQTALPANISNMSVLLRGTKLGIDPGDPAAWQRFLRELQQTYGSKFDLIYRGGKNKITGLDTRGAHIASWDDYLKGGLAGGVLGTTGKLGDRMKITGFGRGLLGDWRNVAIDTHELGGATLGSNAYQRFAIAKDLKPYEYRHFEKMYQKEAARMGVSPAAFQAGRWFGGGEITGLRSPRGDFVQQVEDVLLWNANARGLDASPTGLRKLWDDVVRGDDVLLPPRKVITGEGAHAPYKVLPGSVDF